MANQVILSKKSSESEIKRYFNAVLELSKSDNEYPINLDEVWMLVYPRKDHAVRSLKDNFIENVDYQVFLKNGENQKGGRPSEDYYLTIPCLEFFIARKVRPVFEVYRQVFHKVANSIRSSEPVLTNTFDISALTGKPHATILKDVRKILEQGAGAGDFIKSYGPVQMECGTREYESYDITPKGLLTLATGYPPLLRDLIVAKYVEITGGGSMKTVMRSEKPAAEDVHEYEKRNAELWRIIEEKNRIIDGLKAGTQPSVPQKEENEEEEDGSRPMLVHEMRMRIKEERGIVIPYRRMFSLLVKMGWAIRNDRYTNKPGAVAVRKGYVLECDSKGVKGGSQFYTLRITEKGYRKFVNEVIGKGGLL